MLFTCVRFFTCLLTCVLLQRRKRKFHSFSVRVYRRSLRLPGNLCLGFIGFIKSSTYFALDPVHDDEGIPRHIRLSHQFTDHHGASSGGMKGTR